MSLKKKHVTHFMMFQKFPWCWLWNTLNNILVWFTMALSHPFKVDCYPVLLPCLFSIWYSKLLCCGCVDASIFFVRHETFQPVVQNQTFFLSFFLFLFLFWRVWSSTVYDVFSRQLMVSPHPLWLQSPAQNCPSSTGISTHLGGLWCVCVHVCVCV